MRLLLVEDELYLSDIVSKQLSKSNIDVETAYDGFEALDKILYEAFDIVILDIMLPGIDGLSILEKVREKQNSIPIILTSAKSETKDKIKGLELGADDYLAKPYETDELIARIHTCLRRADKSELNLFDKSFGNMTYDRNTLTISTTTDSVALTLKEFNLLEYLIQTTPYTISKDQIIDKIWGYDNDIMHNQIEVYISYLRKKLKLIEADVKINTTRGVGYYIEVINV